LKEVRRNTDKQRCLGEEDAKSTNYWIAVKLEIGD
jgi:hypothetical protein